MRRATLALCVLLPTVAAAHAKLSYPTPRNPNDNNKSSECGTARTTSAVTYQQGQAVTLRWLETIDHPGHYELRLFDSDPQTTVTHMVPHATFTTLQDIDLNFPDTVCATAPGTPCEYTKMWTVPNVTCSPCTLQLIQFMSDNAAAPYYHSCADITIVPPGSDLSAQPADLAVSPTADLSGAAATDMAGGSAAPDMAEVDISKLGSPGCSIDGGIALSSLVGIAFLFAIVIFFSRRRSA